MSLNGVRRPVLERAFDLASNGKVRGTRALWDQLKGEGYMLHELIQLHGPGPSKTAYRSD